jgi:hypothetical protein
MAYEAFVPISCPFNEAFMRHSSICINFMGIGLASGRISYVKFYDVWLVTPPPYH